MFWSIFAGSLAIILLVLVLGNVVAWGLTRLKRRK